MKTLIVASLNQNKIKEIGEILTDYNVMSCKDFGFDKDVEETGLTYQENAIIKARAVYEFLGSKYAVLADDSGLSVKALGGAPGIYSARYSGFHGNDNENIDKLLKELDGIDDRSAKFVCSLALIEDGKIITAEGVTTGKILTARRGNSGFGYDPVFYSDKLNKSFGEATKEEKNAVSHRCNALKKLRELIK